MKKKLIYTAIALALTTACNDDYFDKGNDHEASDYIGFKIDLDDSGEFQSRGVASAHSGYSITIEQTGASIGGRPLYLHTEVRDSIPQAVTCAKNGGLPQSRGTVIKDGELEEIRVSAVVYDGEWGAATGFDPQPYMNNELVEANSSWNTGRFWPRESEWIRFYAHAPIDVLTTDPNNLGGIPFPASDGTEPAFSYTVPAGIAAQKDLLVASAQYAGNHCQTAHLEFGHALTAVRIRIAGDVDQFKITSLTISGLKDQGTYTYNWDTGANGDTDPAKPTHDAGVWSNVTTSDADNAGTYTIFSGELVLNGEGGRDVYGNEVTDENGVKVDYVDMTPLTSSDQQDDLVMLLMPQELTSDATITLEGIDLVNNPDNTNTTMLQAVIGGDGKVWEKGKEVIYTLSFDNTKIEYHLDVTTDTTSASPVSPAAVEFYGAKSRPIYVRSYKMTTSSGGTTYEAVPWRAKISDLSDAGTYKEFDLENDWLVLDNVEGSGIVGKEGEEYKLWHETRSYTMYATEPENSGSHDCLKGRAEVSTSAETPWDLSRNDLYDGSAPQNTANCYVVGAPGYYTLPLVYGNAITGGVDNRVAYETSSYKVDNIQVQLEVAEATEAKTATYNIEKLAQFKDHKGTGISNAWIVKGNDGSHSSAAYTAKEAKVVWMDEPCLVTDVKLNENGDYITFCVRKDNICEGNAVIAVTDTDGLIMWSWHIWVADGTAYYDVADGYGPAYYETGNPGSLITRQLKNRRVNSTWKEFDASTPSANTTPIAGSYIEQEFSILSAALGHCDGETKTYTARNRTILFEQYEEVVSLTDGEQSSALKNVQVVFSQNGATVVTRDNVPYYQYGRKDPMLPGWNDATGTSVDKKYYDDDWTPETTLEKGGQATLSDAIQNPATYYTRSTSYGTDLCHFYNWCSEPALTHPYCNLWNSQSDVVPGFVHKGNVVDYVSNTNELAKIGVTKTVYDPCPPGYELPRFDAFTGASYNGLNLYPYYYDNTTNFIVDNFTSLSSNVTDAVYATYSLNKQANLWIPPKGYYDTSDNWLTGTTGNGGITTLYNGVSIYCETMDEVGKPGDRTMDGGGPLLFVQFWGHRTNSGTLLKYGIFASALTCAPSCLQWYDDKKPEYLQYELLRLCIIRPYSLRTQSTSAFDLAFPIMPAKTGCNPSTVIIDADAGWSSGDDYNGGSFDIEF